MLKSIERLGLAAGLFVLACAADPAQKAETVSRPAVSAVRAPPVNSLAPTPEPVASAAPAPAPERCEPLVIEAPEAITTRFDVPLPPLIDPEWRGLSSFYRRLAELARGQAKQHVRIAVYGDSNLTDDLLTGEMRRVLQARFGDAGHGYVAFGKPWPWYRHVDIEHDLEQQAFRSFAVSTDAARDQAYGFGGIAAESLADGARAWVRTVKTSASRVQVFYLERPGGRRFAIRADGKELSSVETAGERLSAGHRELALSDQPHDLVFVADRGVRLFGVALEREAPGVVVDSLGVGGANEVLLARMNREIVSLALAQRPYDLVIFLTGATEDDGPAHDAALSDRIRLHQAALPGASLLVLSPPDLAYGTEKKPRASQRITRLARRKQRVAAETGCAYWDFHAAMGGELSILKFRASGMAHSDLVHLNERGAAYMARRLLIALIAGFNDYARACRS